MNKYISGPMIPLIATAAGSYLAYQKNSWAMPVLAIGAGSGFLYFQSWKQAKDDKLAAEEMRKAKIAAAAPTMARVARQDNLSSTSYGAQLTSGISGAAKNINLL